MLQTNNNPRALTQVISAFALAITLMFSSGVADAQQARPLANGILVEVPTEMDVRASYSIPISIPGLNPTEYNPQLIPKSETLFGSSQTVVLFRDVHQYEFAFVPVRQMKMKMRSGDTVTSWNVWYMMYRVRNFGTTLSYEKVKDRFEHTNFQLRRAATAGGGFGKPTIDINDPNLQSTADTAEEIARLRRIESATGVADSNQPPETVREFNPRFLLRGWVEDYVPGAENTIRPVGYRDQIFPAIVREIQRREDPQRVLLDTVQIAREPIPVSRSVTDPGTWGVAIWAGVDPNIDYVSVQVEGLTNAHRLDVQDDGSIELRTRALQLNFWRPGDRALEHEDDIRYGIPLVDNPAEQSEICRRYGLPGPLIRGYWNNELANRELLVVEADAAVNLTDFKSALVPVLNGGTLPPEIVASFAQEGISIPANSPVTTMVPGLHWQFADGNGRNFVLRFEPQYWERKLTGGIRFIKGLDHLWVYR